MSFDPISFSLARRLGRKLQIVGHRGQVLGQQANGGGGGTNYTRNESRYQFTLGMDAADLRLAYGNYTVDAGTGETDGLNDITVEAAIETTSSVGTINQSPAFYPMLFDGQRTRLLSPGAQAALTDTLGLDGAMGANFFARTGLTVASGQFWPRGMVGSLGGSIERTYDSTNTASQIYATGALAAGVSGVTASYGYSPLAILGVPTQPGPAVIIMGDSIADGFGDANAGDGLGNRGWIARGLWGVRTPNVPIPWMKVTRASDTLAANKRSVSWRRRALWQYATHIVCELIINQLVPQTPAAQQAYMLDIWLSARRHGLKVYQSLCTPQTTSTDAWATVANQSFDPVFAANRASSNAYIVAAAAAGVIDGYFDPAATWEDPGNPGKWLVGKTDDGTHPTESGHVSAGDAFRVYAARFYG